MNRIFTLIAIVFSLPTLAQVLEIETMLDNRYAHTLNDVGTGKVVACGGTDADAVLGTAEAYDFLNNQWSYVGEMLSPRTDHTSAPLFNGQFILIGGWNGEINLATTEVYDPATEEFSEGPMMPFATSTHRSCTIAGGHKVLVTGGYDGFTNIDSCAILDIELMEFSPAASMHYARSSHTATTLEDGRVLVTGGYNPDFGYQMTVCEIYDPVADEWTEVSPMNVARDNHAAVLISGGRVLVCGGRYYNGDLNLFQGLKSAEIYDPATDQWSPVADMLSGHSYHQAFAMPVSLMDLYLVPGGTNESGIGVDMTYSPTEYYNALNDQWIDAGDLNLAAGGRYRYAATNFNTGIIVNGGTDGAGSTGEYYNFPSSVQEHPGLSVEIYPNPASHLLIVKTFTTPSAYTVFDVNGEKVRSGSFRSKQSALDVSALGQGLYFLVIDGKENASTHFLIQR